MIYNINQLSGSNTVSGSDLLAIWQTANSDSRKISVNLLTQYMQSAIGSGGAGTGAERVEVAGPTFSGFSVVLPTTTDSIWLILAPTGHFATGTITLPPSASIVDKQEVIVTSTNQIDVLTINPNGAGLGLVPNIIGAGGFFTLKYSQTLNTWYRVA